MTRIKLFTEQPMLACGLQSLFEASAEFTVASTCENLPELLEGGSDAVDLYLVETTPAVTLEMLGRLVSIAGRSHVVLWVESVAHEFLSQAIAVGIRGIVRKALPLPTFLDALHQVVEGGLWIEKDLSDRLLIDRPVPLTGRERQLVTLLAQGLKNKELAWALGITEGTVKVYLSRLFQKVGVNDRFELALYALKSLCSSPTGEVELLRPALRHQSAETPSGQFPIPRITTLARVRG